MQSQNIKMDALLQRPFKLFKVTVNKSHLIFTVDETIG